MADQKDFLWCSPHPNHYHRYLLECTANAGLAVDAVYFKKIIAKYPWQSDFTKSGDTFLKPTFAGIDWSFLFSKKWKNYTWVTVAGWNERTMIIMLLVLAISRKKFILYSDTPKQHNRKGIKQFIRKKWLGFLFNHAGFIFSTGQPGIQGFLQMGVPKHKLINFPFLTNLDYFKPALQPSINQLPVIFASGRLDNAHKGYDIALEALHILQSEGFSFLYKIAGEGPDRQMIEQQIINLQLQQAVELSGWMEPDALLAAYQNADVFLHAARFDPYPNAVLEAMACGLPVVCSDKAGSGLDRIEQGSNGRLFESKNKTDLTNQLRQVLLLKTEDKTIMGINARKTALKWDFPYHIEVLKKVLTGT